MAYYEHLPIYKKAMDFAVYIETIVRNFTRYHKYSLGKDLRYLVRQIIKDVITANSKSEVSLRVEILERLREHLEECKICLRIGKEIKAFVSFNGFIKALEQLVDLCKQCEGWLKQTKLQARAVQHT
jgi:hypothetical protein